MPHPAPLPIPVPATTWRARTAVPAMAAAVGNMYETRRACGRDGQNRNSGYEIPIPGTAAAVCTKWPCLDPWHGSVGQARWCVLHPTRKGMPAV